MLDLWVLVICAAAATYLWRGLGVLLSGRIEVETELFHWIACVAYAMIAGLVSRILLMPAGMLAETALLERLGACAIGLVVYRAANRNLLLSIASGVGAIVLMALARGG